MIKEALAGIVLFKEGVWRASSRSTEESMYGADEARQWIKVKNTAYSQAVDRHELFER